jgi:hypothetical protein
MKIPEKEILLNRYILGEMDNEVLTVRFKQMV